MHKSTQVHYQFPKVSSFFFFFFSSLEKPPKLFWTFCYLCDNVMPQNHLGQHTSHLHREMMKSILLDEKEKSPLLFILSMSSFHAGISEGNTLIM